MKRNVWKQILPIMAIMILLVVLRIFVGNFRSLEYTHNGLFDDYALVNNANFSSSYNNPTFITFVKTLSFSWFLNFASWFPFSINTVISLYWTLDAFLMFWLLRENKLSQKWCLFGFAFTLFCPSAFENNIGIRMYRNILLAPSCLLFLSTLSIAFCVVWKRRIQYWKLWVCAVIMAITFPFAYYIKEDGVWMLLTLILFTTLIFAGIIINFLKNPGERKLVLNRVILSIFSLILPFLSFNISTIRYIETNRKYLNYPYITLRTDGEFFKFVEYTYKIDSDDRSLVIWSPLDTFSQIVEISPTLQSMPEFTDKVLNDSWILQGNDVTGDFMGWVLLIALRDLNLYESPEQVNELFKKINDDVEHALQNGSLKEADGLIYLTSKSSGRTLKETFELFPELFVLYIATIFLPGYEASLEQSDTEAYPNYQTQEGLNELLSEWSERLKVDLVSPKNTVEYKQWVAKRNIGVIVSSAVIWVYRILTPVLFFGGATIWILKLLMYFAAKLKYTQNDWRIMWLIFFLMGLSFVYGIALIWFCQFLDYQAPISKMIHTLTYYGPGMLGMIYPSILLAPGLLNKKKIELI